MKKPTTPPNKPSQQTSPNSKLEEDFPILHHNATVTARSIFSTPEEVEEIVSSLWPKVTSVYAKEPPNHPKTWIAKVTRNACYDQLRRQKVRLNKPLEDYLEEPISSLSPSQLLEQDERREATKLLIEAVREVREELPEHLQDLYDQIFLEGKPLSQIFSQPGMKPREVKLQWAELMETASKLVISKVEGNKMTKELFAAQLKKKTCESWAIVLLRQIARFGLLMSVGDYFGD